MSSPLARVGQRVRFMRDHRWTRRRASEYIDGELDPGGHRRAEHHASECPECNALLNALHSMVVVLGGMRGDAGHDVASAVLAGVRDELRGGHDRPV